MFDDISIKNAVTTIVENFLPRFSDPKLCMVITIDMQFDDYGYDADGNTKELDEKFSRSTTVELIFQRPSNYTKVLARTVSKKGGDYWKIEREIVEMQLYSDHDSCWKDDGLRLINKVWLDVVNEYDSLYPNRDRVRHLGYFHSFSIFNQPKFHLLDTFEPIIKGKGHISSYKIKLGKKLSIKEAAEYMPD